MHEWHILMCLPGIQASLYLEKKVSHPPSTRSPEFRVSPQVRLAFEKFYPHGDSSVNLAPMFNNSLTNKIDV